MVEGEERLASGEKVAAQGLHLAAGCGMGDHHGAGQFGGNAVALHGGFFCDARHDVGKRRHHDQPAIGHRRTAVDRSCGYLAVKSPGQTPDDLMRGAQQNAQALLFHRRMKTADDRYAFGPEALGKLVGFENQLAGTFDGAEQRDQRTLQDSRITDGME